MLTVEIKVNGALIGHVYAVNEGKKISGRTLFPITGECAYRWEHYRPDAGVCTGRLKHRREDGAEALVSKILAAVRKATKKAAANKE